MKANRFRFRAWDREQLKMHYFTKLTVCDNCIVFDNEAFDLGENHNDDGSPILMQSTGLTDKNGKEIFEGDMVRYGVGISIIQWDDKLALFCNYDVNCAMQNQKYEPSKNRCYYLDRITNAEVIGNIWQHPELVERREG